ncbi:MAG: YqgE/AlgH family protein [Alphaproteobacteria bacterium]|nr:YqgE/AlgH family protein [Alphaproteobacteria bacterium]
MEVMEPTSQGYLVGQLLIATPQIQDPRFSRTVIYVCAHSQEGAMGLVVNRRIGSAPLPDLLEQLGVDTPTDSREINLFFGGPVESERGFVLHSAEYQQDSTLKIDSNVALTASAEILKDIAQGRGPRKSMVVLGYAGWAPGQLEVEIRNNGWLHASADELLIFDEELDAKWEMALAKIGVDWGMLSGQAGNA